MNIGGGKGGNFVRDLVKVYAFSRADRRKKSKVTTILSHQLAIRSNDYLAPVQLLDVALLIRAGV